MSKTTFSGPVASNNGFILEIASVGDLVTATSPINTQYKQLGKVVSIQGSGLLVTAQGSNPTDSWYGSDNVAVYTPA